MTKDEAIEVLREALTKAQDYSDSVGVYDMCGKALAATSDIEAPTSEAVAAEVDGLLVGEEEDYDWGGSEDEGGSLTPGSIDFATLRANIRAAIERAAQPAADHAPVPAKGISHGCPKDTPYGPAICFACAEADEAAHAKRAEGEVLDEAKLIDLIMQWEYSPRGEKAVKAWDALLAFLREWQARGQQAGVEFEQVAEILGGIDKEETNDPSGWWETSTGAAFGANKLERIRSLFVGAAAPGEAG